VDAGEFDDLMGQVIAKRTGGSASGKLGGESQAEARGVAGGGASSGRTVTAGGRSYALTTGEVQGRPVVVYVDVPAGAPTALLDLRDVRLQ